MQNPITAPSDVFTLNAVDGTITLQTDPAIAKDLIYALTVLLDLSRTIRTKVLHARAFAIGIDQEEVERRQVNFKNRSLEIFGKFQEHMNNGCQGDKAKAIQCVKKDFNVGYGEAKIYVIEGRRLSKLIKSASPTRRVAGARACKVKSSAKSSPLPPSLRSGDAGGSFREDTAKAEPK